MPTYIRIPIALLLCLLAGALYRVGVSVPDSRAWIVWFLAVILAAFIVVMWRETA